MRKLLLLPCMLASQALFAEESVWSDIIPEYQSRSSEQVVNTYKSTRKLSLDYDKLSLQLTELGNTLFEFPLPSGESVMLRTKSNSVLAPNLAAKYPKIKSWHVYAPNDSSITGSIDIGPNGFHGYIQTADGSHVFIDPDNIDDHTVYTSVVHEDSSNESNATFSCELHDHSTSSKPDFTSEAFISGEMSTLNERSASAAADPLITYRLAIAVTGEYTQLYGGTKANAMAGITTTINRVNEIYQRDLGILLEIVENNDDIIYTSPDSDPYTNEDAVAMVEENVVNINSVIGTANYDVGHVFGTGNTGGLAFIDSTCGQYKAGGVTGSNSPLYDAFNVDYVAHELAHQLGASHTFNGYQLNCSAGNREPDMAVEPGSGSSIMAYAGICGSDNLQSNSDAFFHSVSINEIKKFTREGAGAVCGSITTNTNNSPEVDAGADYDIPAATPFSLTGETIDLDGDDVTHSWEQVDTGDTGGLYTDLGNNPLFRTWPPTEEATRYFPRLSDQINNSSTIGEILPTMDRDLNFRLLARDNNGSTNQDDMRVNVVNTGQAFAVTSQTTDTTLSANQSIIVTWDVAGTNESPINCTNVDINVLHMSGHKSPLLEATSNDGSESVTIPDTTFDVDNIKLQVACSDNIFFALSEGNISVIGGSPVLGVNTPSILEGDSGTQNLSFILHLTSQAEEMITVNYSIEEEDTGTTIQRGQAIILEGEYTTTIHTPVDGNLVNDGDQVLLLNIDKPNNAQFLTGDDVLVAEGTVFDDDTAIAANPEPTEDETAAAATTTSTTIVRTTDVSAGGGGSFGILTMLGLILLSVARRTFQRIQS